MTVEKNMKQRILLVWECRHKYDWKHRGWGAWFELG